MTMPDSDYVPVEVHLRSVSIAAAAAMGGKKRCRVSMSARVFVLNATDPVQEILPQSDSRVWAWIYVSTATNPIFIGGAKADVQAAAGASGGNGAALIPAALKWDVPTTDLVYAGAAAASLPVTITVTAFYEQPE
jgi:hypothetical protein